ncbi:MAG: DUF1887 family protein [Candidatus Brocadia sp.]|nr:DUF1887 family protein [Candidatus Brocadia sp.]
MKRILVSLVSEQTIPNILAIYHFKPDGLLFVSTKKMEDDGKTTAILKTLEKLGFKYESKPIIVQEDSILDCHKQINKWIEGKEDAEFIVNLTGGTKIMSIAAYEHFKDYSSKMVYIPIPKNEFIVPFPKKTPGLPTKLDLKLTVTQYMIAYGLKIINESKLKGYHEEAYKRKDLSEWIVKNYGDFKNTLSWLSDKLRPNRDKKEFYFEDTFQGMTQGEIQFFSRFGFKNENGAISKKLERSEIIYLTGGWLEEFCFNTILKWHCYGIDDVVIGLQLRNSQGRDNEFDVMFTKDNALYFVECKSLDQHEDKNAAALYKVGALQREFGLRVESFFVTTSPYILKDGKVKESVQARAEQFKTTIIPPPLEIDKFGEVIANKLNLNNNIY